VALVDLYCIYHVRPYLVLELWVLVSHVVDPL